MDVAGQFPETCSRNRYILVIVDCFSRYVQLIPLKGLSGREVTQKVIRKWFCYHGAPECILTDVGGNFRSDAFKDACKLWGVNKIFTAPYNPQSDGQCEKTLGYLMKTLGFYVNDRQTNWDKLLDPIAFAYNSKVHSISGFSPHMLLYGRKLNLPSEEMLRYRIPRYMEEPELIDELYDTMGKAFEERRREAGEESRHNTDKAKARYIALANKNRKSAQLELEVGDFCVLKQHDKPKRMSGKFIHKYQGPFLVQARERATAKIRLVNPITGVFLGHAKWQHLNNLKRYKARDHDHQIDNSQKIGNKADDDHNSSLSGDYAQDTTSEGEDAV